jgi:hypothetical protein
MIALLDMFYYESHYEMNIIKIIGLPNDNDGEYLVLFDDGSSGYFNITASDNGLIMFNYLSTIVLNSLEYFYER